MTIRILLVDDHPVVRSGLAGMLTLEDDFEIVGQAGNGLEAIEKVAEVRPDIVLMDLRMPGMDGVTAIKHITRQTTTSAPAPRIIVLTTYDTDADILHAVEAGATGYLLKDTPHEDLVKGVRAAARGETVLAPAVATRLVGSVRATSERLTPRETQVLALVAEGLSNAEVARKLYIGESTVKTHLLRSYTKLGVDSRAGAVTEARRRGYLT